MTDCCRMDGWVVLKTNSLKAGKMTIITSNMPELVADSMVTALFHVLYIMAFLKKDSTVNPMDDNIS